ncbi:MULTISPECIES: UDP-N-acetylmuramoylalanyl-D-glutamyl-2,6-diaminopimelate--D-alanyl-D-alanine ligase [Sinorhizobium]|uniref:UDP-N-acetylmuramoyl-tripeptide--D-alanyl-D-alanine ligase n=1 Tax=Sinorhizobium americanum TaxID=194963 RepID=A0A2S3YMT5_9HYPH|nr:MULTISPECIES: UDP-N-acetylmuramoylalanyl-D-glutamyl-2,6-diaminopimelate--D-alanyl-D-alanine ligase [Sinorhizobium]ASY57183.1 UDP-N-acetylmuramoylalanyl-D-glutamyl-2,6-diaminopimelate--D-alanyl-D-alanine ligase [Sinorhizobium sp. CCBAU 05631]PDT42463.1 UDP-N-acetylmuramoylalanyl-D-glutamyl-2, 6-diaminopimelate--D-alanyl-D-alanine ligase [Sinorhizobium sp. FG01]POH30383.1 UDP-N-acetylmuramoylalanyl-D-glutamyl-2, 6-diaminopimelate--D-alanyl-D-alanine ligase [Sinorhizobium americanum]
MSWLWTSSDLLAAMNGRPVGNLPEGIIGISIDSRTIEKGEAFFAIRGDRVDGHDYAGIALANGASLLVVSEGKLPALGRLIAPMIVVDDVLEAMIRLGCAARDRSAAKVIAVTGSVGKTTTKEMLRHVLSPLGRVHASVASFNNHWGVPLTLARMPETTDFGIFEIGMNHPGEIRPLSAMVRPHVAVVTSIAAAHLGNFASLDEIAAAKAEIFEGVVKGGHAVINRDSPQFELLERAAAAAGISHIHSFGANPKSEYRLIEFAGGADRSVLWAGIGGRTLEVTIGAPGRHIAENALAVIAAAQLAGADIDRVLASLATMQPEKGRGLRHRLKIGGGHLTLIDESYNANPASMRAAIALLRDAEPPAGGRRIAILGDMLEMGEHAAAVHAALADPIVEAGITDVWLAGPDMAHLRDALPVEVAVVHREAIGDLTSYALGAVAAGDVVMVKSSKGTGCAKIVQALLDAYPEETAEAGQV